MKKRALFMLGFIAATFTGCRDNTSFYSNVLRSDVFTQAYTISKIDFLMVIDDSLTMSPRRAALIDQMGNFITILTSRKVVDYHIAFVTTNYFSDGGNLMDTTVGPGVGVQVITSDDPDPVGTMTQMFDTLNYEEDGTALGLCGPNRCGSFWEHGLESMYLAVKNHGSESDFIRSGVPLAIAIFTDEDDYSCKQGCFNQEPENNPNWVAWPISRYTSYFATLKKSEDTIVAIYPVVAKDFAECTVGSIGIRYQQVAHIVTAAYQPGVDAQIGSVCVSTPTESSAIAQSFRNIAQDVADRGTVFPLSSSAKTTGINVFVAGEEIPFSLCDGSGAGTWTFDQPSNSIIFCGSYAPPNGSVIEVTYSANVD